MKNNTHIWKTYFIFYVIGTLAAYIVEYSNTQRNFMFESIDALSFLVLTTALYGYITKKIIFNAVVWKILKYFYLFIFIFSLSGNKYINLKDGIILIITVLFLSPAIVALFKYTAFVEMKKSNKKFNMDSGADAPPPVN